MAPVIPKFQEIVLERFSNTAENMRVFDYIHDALDIHYLRAVYAKFLYGMYYDENEIMDRKNRYICRGSQKGRVFSRSALLRVSSGLGHERVDTSIVSYLYL